MNTTGSQPRPPIRIGVIVATPSRGWGTAAHLPALAALEEFKVTAVATTRGHLGGTAGDARRHPHHRLGHLPQQTRRIGRGAAGARAFQPGTRGGARRAAEKRRRAVPRVRPGDQLRPAGRCGPPWKPRRASACPSSSRCCTTARSAGGHLDGRVPVRAEDRVSRVGEELVAGAGRGRVGGDEPGTAAAKRVLVDHRPAHRSRPARVTSPP